MIRRLAALALSTTLVVMAFALPAPTTAAETDPKSMAATGDSITRAFNLCFFPFTDCPAQSWSTGTSSTVRSHAYRLGITRKAYNDAVSGARMADLPGQADVVAGRNVDYVTVLMGGNDVCTDTEGGMTPPSDYVAAFKQAMNKLGNDPDGSPPLVYVVSVPNVKMLWEILKDDSSARSAWSRYNICQSLLANPLSEERADVDRRERVKQRNMEFNQLLRAACASYTFCRFDGERVFGTPFIPNDVSTRDYFHPSTAGQTKLADVSWTYGPLRTSVVNAPPSASFVADCPDIGLTCTFTDTSTDGTDPTSGRSWNFDAARTGGATSDDEVVTHTFAAGGTYTVKLYAIDQDGATASTSQQVTVTADGGSGGGESSTGTLSGTVTDASTAGTPIVGATVAVDGTTLRATTDALGAYEITGVTAGPVTVTASADGFEPLTQSTSVVEGGTTNLDFALEPTPTGGDPPAPMRISELTGEAIPDARGPNWTAQVTITVEDSSGIRLAGAEVTGEWSTGGSSTCTTLADGTCSASVSLHSKKQTSTTFTVQTVTLSGYEYVREEDDKVTVQLL